MRNIALMLVILLCSISVCAQENVTEGALFVVGKKGKVAGQELVREIPVNLPESEVANDVLATLWARTKIDDLMNKSLKYDAEEEEAFLDLKAKTKLDIIGLSLKYNLLTEFTSFVAVEEKVRTVGGKPRKVEVPVELAEGTFGNNESLELKSKKKWDADERRFCGFSRIVLSKLSAN